MRAWRGYDPVDWSVRRLTGRATTAGREASRRIVLEAPEEDARAAYRRAADRTVARGGLRVQRLRANLSRAVAGDALADAVQDAVRAGFAERYERLLPPERLASGTRVEGAEHLAPGVVLAAGHLPGRWRARAALVDGALEDLRDAPDDLGRLEAERRLCGGAVLLVPADHPGSATYDGTVEVDLLGEAARLTSWPHDVARRTGAPVVPVTGHRHDAGVVLTLHPPVDGPQPLADVLAGAVRTHPADWHLARTVFVKDLLARL